MGSQLPRTLRGEHSAIALNDSRQFQTGNDDATAAERAYVGAMNSALPDRNIAYAPPNDCAAVLDRALPGLDRLAPAGKALVVEGLVRAISDDGTVSVAESELLRTICGALHCPLPPLLADSV